MEVRSAASQVRHRSHRRDAARCLLFWNMEVMSIEDRDGLIVANQELLDIQLLLSLQ